MAAAARRIPDVSGRVAVRADVPWEELPDGRIRIRKRKFGAAGSRLLAVFKVPPELKVTLDTLGSAAWKRLDGRTVGAVLDGLKQEFPGEDDLGPRLGDFLSTMVSNGLVRLR